MAVKEWLLIGNSGTSPAHDFVGTSDDQPLVIKTADTERLRIDTAGNIGIGTSTPAYAVHLAPGKPLRIEGGMDAADPAAYFSFGEYGSFSIDAPGVPGGRFVVDNSGKVGIANPAPAFPLHLAAGQALRIEAGTSETDDTSYFSFGGNGAFSIDAFGVPGGRFVVTNTGAVGVGNPAPVFPLDVVGSARVSNVTQRGDQYYVSFLEENAAAGALVLISNPVWNDLGPILALSNPSNPASESTPGNAAALDFYTFSIPSSSPNTIPSSRIQAIDVGNFGNDIVFLSNTPGAPANSLIEQMRITSAGNINVPGDIILTGADCAEQFDLSPGAELPEPGTVMVLSDAGGLTESRGAYDRKVVGVVSGAGDYKHAILLDKRPGSPDSRVAVALAGKVCCKVDAQYGPVGVGDLLTTSPTPGHAMKATEPGRGFGSVVGKALQALDHDQGLIPIVVALQ